MIVNDEVIVVAPIDLQPGLRLESGGDALSNRSQREEVPKAVAHQRIARENIEGNTEDGHEERSSGHGTKHSALMRCSLDVEILRRAVERHDEWFYSGAGCNVNAYMAPFRRSVLLK